MSLCRILFVIQYYNGRKHNLNIFRKMSNSAEMFVRNSKCFDRNIFHRSYLSESLKCLTNEKFSSQLLRSELLRNSFRSSQRRFSKKYLFLIRFKNTILKIIFGLFISLSEHLYLTATGFFFQEHLILPTTKILLFSAKF